MAIRIIVCCLTFIVGSLAVSPDAFSDWCSLHDKRFGSLAEHQQRRGNFYANRAAGGMSNVVGLSSMRLALSSVMSLLSRVLVVLSSAMLMLCCRL